MADPRATGEGRSRRRDDLQQTFEQWGGVAAVGMLAILVGAALVAFFAQRPPRPAGEDAPATEFSAARAWRHLETIAREPHPLGTAAHDAVRDYLAAQLRELGLETDVQRANLIEKQPRQSLIVKTTVDNVLGRLRGSSSSGAVLFVAHYDSAETSPGAGDDGAGVAALLESARALKAGPPLPNDVILLFSDGEEVGLFGAEAFVEEHPWAKDVAVVVNLEGRGSSGPVMMFETSEDNGWWIPRFIEASPRPQANSLMNQIYRSLPNDTDLTVFLRAGYSGFNLAFIEGLTAYHTALDTPQHLDRGSLQHHGSYALALARSFGQIDFAATPPAARRSPDRIYFNVLGPLMVHYGQSVGLVVSALTVLLFLGLLGTVVSRRRLSGASLVKGTLFSLLTLVLVPVAITLLWSLIVRFAGVPILRGSTPQARFFMLAFTLVALVLFLLLSRLGRRFAGTLGLAAGSLIWWLLLVVLTSGFWLPITSSFLFVWPLLFALFGFTYLALTPSAALRPGRTVAVLTLAALPGLLLLVPFCAGLYVGLQSLYQLGGVGLVPVVLLLGLLGPQFALVTARRPAWLPLAAAGVAVLLLGVALANADGNVATHRNSLLYTADVDTGQNAWLTFDGVPDSWTRSLGFEPGVTGSFHRFFPWQDREYLRAEAPAANLPQPQLEVLGRSEGDPQQVHLRLHAAAGAALRYVWFEPRAAVLAAHLGEVELPVHDFADRFVIVELPVASPVEDLVLRVQNGAGLTIEVVEQLPGLPLELAVAPRPATMMPSYISSWIRNDGTLVRRSFELPPAAPVSEVAATPSS